MVSLEFIHIFVILVSIIVGFSISKFGARWIRNVRRKRLGVGLGPDLVSKLFSYLTSFVTLIFVLFLIRVTINNASLFYSYFIRIVSSFLILILLIFLIEFIMLLFNIFLEFSGLLIMIRDHSKENILNIILLVIRVILYIILFLFSMNFMGVKFVNVSNSVKYILLPLLAVIGLLFILGIKDVIQNAIKGLFLKSNNLFREGEYVKFENEVGIVKKIDYHGIHIETELKYKYFIPYDLIFQKGIHSRRIDPNLDTLEKIKDKFIAQHPSYCGPASLAIILKIWGYDVSQDQIGNVAGVVIPKNGEPGGSKPWDLIHAVNSLTSKEVTGVWIDFDNIVNLKEEVRSWLNEGAYLVVDYKKSALFPTAKKAHYSVCIGIKDEELLILDPSSKTGGVYYASCQKVSEGMDTYSELLKGKRGYMVIAKKGTSAFERIQKGDIYHKSDVYSQLRSGILKNFNKLYNEQINSKIIPKSILDYIAKFKDEEYVNRVWSPQSVYEKKDKEDNTKICKGG